MANSSPHQHCVGSTPSPGSTKSGHLVCPEIFDSIYLNQDPVLHQGPVAIHSTTDLGSHYAADWRHQSHSPQEQFQITPTRDGYNRPDSYALMPYHSDPSNYSPWPSVPVMTPLPSTTSSTHSHNSPRSSSGSYLSHHSSGGGHGLYLPQNNPSGSYLPHNSPSINSGNTFLPPNSQSNSSYSPHLAQSRMQTQSLQLSPVSAPGQPLLLSNPHSPLANHPHSPSTSSMHCSSSAASSPTSHEWNGAQHSANEAESQSNPSLLLLLNGSPAQKQDAIFFWKCVMQDPANQPIIPQPMYRPHTQSDRRRYVEAVELSDPIYFCTGDGLGVWLLDALRDRLKGLKQPETEVLQNRGPSVSIRLEWHGYPQFSRQIPTKDFKSPPRPITRKKLAKNIAKCIERFIEENKIRRQEDDADRRWRVGTESNTIRVEDIMLLSLHHVSMGSWQPQLKLRRRV